jgi:archaellum biogenesis ATPase FlaH
MNKFKEFVPIGKSINSINANKDSGVSQIESENLFYLKGANEWLDLAKQQNVPNMLFGSLWFEGELCIMTADTNIGKSILGVQIGDCITKGIGSSLLPFMAQPQAVIYGDFELSFKQFEKRYSANYNDHYSFSDRFYRMEINPDFSKLDDFNEQLMENLEKEIKKTDTKVIIIDNLTFLRTQSMDTAKEALPLMQRLKALKTRYGLSMLVLAHTPKRSVYNPLTRNDIAGSKHLANFADSIFGIGESAMDKSYRYIKQLKARATEIEFGEDSVLECRIVKDYNFLKFAFIGLGEERNHLKVAPEKEELEKQILNIKSEKPNASLREIASELGTNQVKVMRILKSNNFKTN